MYRLIHLDKSRCESVRARFQTSSRECIYLVLKYRVSVNPYDKHPLTVQYHLTFGSRALQPEEHTGGSPHYGKH